VNEDETAGVNEEETTGVAGDQIESDDEPPTDVKTAGMDDGTNVETCRISRQNKQDWWMQKWTVNTEDKRVNTDRTHVDRGTTVMSTLN
jgi:hypothetical protein